MQEDTERLTRLIDDLLELSQIESKEIGLKLELLDLAAEVGKILSAFHRQIEGKKIRVETHLRDAPSVRADRDKLKQIFVNLIDNAIKFNKEGGRVILR